MGVNQRDHFLFVGSRPETKAHAHAAKTQSRYFQSTIAEFARLHKKLLIKNYIADH